jgi:phage terminase small subunit
MASQLAFNTTMNPNIKPLTVKQLAFVSAYLSNGCNGTQACKDAGYTCKSENAYAKQASALLRTENVAQELSYRLQEIEDAKVAKRSEILQFYTSVMRGEVLDQFGIEAALDTRIKAANELAKHMIELPMKLEQKNITNNIGNITLNFIPRHDDDVIDME